MILYSIVPAEFVFNRSTSLDEVKFLEADYKGERILVAQMQDKHYEISRLLSTRPDSFLKPALQPGSIVDAKELKILE